MRLTSLSKLNLLADYLIRPDGPLLAHSYYVHTVQYSIYLSTFRGRARGCYVICVFFFLLYFP